MRAWRERYPRLYGWSHRLVGWLLMVLVSLIGVAAFIAPFFVPEVVQTGPQQAHAQDAPLLMALLVVLALAVLFVELEQDGLNTKTVALLGVLTAFNASLRLFDAVLSVFNIGGFSPVFALVIVGGYVFGARFGFLLGAMTMFVSALLTGGMGPWVPFQMFATGWVGMSAAWLAWVVRPRLARGRLVARREVVALVVFGGVWGYVYGILMNLFFWPFVGGGEMYWQPGITWRETLQRYAAFYLLTSLAWDTGRAVGNVLLLGLIGAPTLRILRRFYVRFFWSPVASGLSEQGAHTLLAPLPSHIDMQK
nr:ECF transporter S component [Ardenticatena sp.]